MASADWRLRLLDEAAERGQQQHSSGQQVAQAGGRERREKSRSDLTWGESGPQPPVSRHIEASGSFLTLALAGSGLSGLGE